MRPASTSPGRSSPPAAPASRPACWRWAWPASATTMRPSMTGPGPSGALATTRRSPPARHDPPGPRRRPGRHPGHRDLRRHALRRLRRGAARRRSRLAVRSLARRAGRGEPVGRDRRGRPAGGVHRLRLLWPDHVRAGGRREPRPPGPRTGARADGDGDRRGAGPRPDGCRVDHQPTAALQRAVLRVPGLRRAGGSAAVAGAHRRRRGAARAARPLRHAAGALMEERTRLIRAGKGQTELAKTVGPPIQKGSTVLLPNAEALYDERHLTYGRGGLAAQHALMDALAELERAEGVRLFPSGLAAITGAILGLVGAGDEVLVTDGAYRPTRRFCDRVLKRFGVRVRYYAPRASAEALMAMATPATRLIVLESPASLTFEMQDVG